MNDPSPPPPPPTADEPHPPPPPPLPTVPQLFQTADGGGREAGDCLASFVQLKFDQKGGTSALLFSPDGSTLYSGASDGTLAAWKLSWKEAPPAGRPGSGGLRRGFL